VLARASPATQDVAGPSVRPRSTCVIEKLCTYLSLPLAIALGYGVLTDDRLLLTTNSLAGAVDVI
jgi:hypothetical protein